MPTTLLPVKPVTRLSSYTIASSGFDTTITNASGQCFFRFSPTLRMILRLMPSRSSRDMPGLRGTPAVTMTTSAPAQSAQLDVPLMCGVVAEHGAVLLEVQRLSLAQPFLLGDVEQHDVAELAARAQRGQLAADVAGADEGNLVPAGHL